MLSMLTSLERPGSTTFCCSCLTCICLPQLSKLYLMAADALFQNTGLERAGPVSTDIDDLAAEYNLQKPEAAADGPGSNYAK